MISRVATLPTVPHPFPVCWQPAPSIHHPHSPASQSSTSFTTAPHPRLTHTPPASSSIRIPACPNTLPHTSLPTPQLPQTPPLPSHSLQSEPSPDPERAADQPWPGILQQGTIPYHTHGVIYKTITIQLTSQVNDRCDEIISS